MGIHVLAYFEPCHRKFDINNDNLIYGRTYQDHYRCSVLRYLSVTIVTLYPVRHDRYMIVKVHSYVKVVLLIPSIVL